MQTKLANQHGVDTIRSTIFMPKLQGSVSSRLTLEIYGEIMKRLLIATLLCISPLVVQAKPCNFVIINNLMIGESQPDIVGVYIIPYEGRSNLRNNKKIQWGKNLIKKPIEFGDYEKFECYDNPQMKYNFRIDFEGKTPEGEPIQYFHSRCSLHDNGIIHHWIISLKDRSSPWKRGGSLLRDEMRTMEKKILQKNKQ